MTPSQTEAFVKEAERKRRERAADELERLREAAQDMERHRDSQRQKDNDKGLSDQKRRDNITTASVPTKWLGRQAGNVALGTLGGTVGTLYRGVGSATHQALRGNLLDASLTLVEASVAAAAKASVGAAGSALLLTGSGALYVAHTGGKAIWSHLLDRLAERKSAKDLSSVLGQGGSIGRFAKVGSVDASSWTIKDLWSKDSTADRLRNSTWSKSTSNKDKETALHQIMNHAAVNGWNDIRIDSKKDRELSRQLAMMGALREPPIRVQGAYLSMSDLDQVSERLLERQRTRDVEAVATAQQQAIQALVDQERRVPGVSMGGMKFGREPWMTEEPDRGFMGLTFEDKKRVDQLYQDWKTKNPTKQMSLQQFTRHVQEGTAREIAQESAQGIRHPSPDEMDDIRKSQQGLRDAMADGTYKDPKWLPPHLRAALDGPPKCGNTRARITLKDGTTIIDSGNALRLEDNGRVTNVSVDIMAAACRARGFKTIEASGPAMFKNALAIRLGMLEPPVKIRDHDLNSVAQRQLDEQLAKRADQRAQANPAAADNLWARIHGSDVTLNDLPNGARGELYRRYQEFLKDSDTTPSEVSLNAFMEATRNNHRNEQAGAPSLIGSPSEENRDGGPRPRVAR